MQPLFSRQIFSFFLFAIVFISCRHTPAHKAPAVVNRYFYFWKDEFYEAGEEPMHKLVDTLHAYRLYVKMLDIDWNEVNHAYPVSITRGGYWYNDDKKWGCSEGYQDLVPVIFITNNTFVHITKDELKPFADKIISKCVGKIEYKEMQIDCDWTEKTKDMYFNFLKVLKGELGPKKLSATIRLFQYKYRTKMGVPPVDKGMLMLYNLHNVKDYNGSNSIFDKQEAMQYIKGVPLYPLHLDFALPAFGWAVVYRDGKFYCMMRDIQPIVSDTCKFLTKLKQESAGISGYLVKDDYVYNDIYLRTGDEIKIENADSTLLLDAASVARECVNSDTVNVSIFEIDEVLRNKIHYETLNKAYNTLQ